MSGLDEARMHLRRRAIQESWPPTMLAIAEDLADTARDDGTHALRTRQAQAERLGISEATVKRHRSELQSSGTIVVRTRGGRGRAQIIDFASPKQVANQNPDNLQAMQSRVTGALDGDPG